MTSAKYDVLGIGNAIFDVLVQTDEGFLGRARHDQGRHGADRRGAGRCDLPGHGAGDGDVRRLGGQHHCRDRQSRRAAPPMSARSRTTRSAGFTPTTSAPPGSPSRPGPQPDGPATGCSYILVTPDGERTMNTYLGAAQELSPSDIDAAEVAASRVVYLEGYLWDPKNAKDAFVKAATIAHDAGPPGRADLVGFVLRRSLSRRISRADAGRHGRSGIRRQ